MKHSSNLSCWLQFFLIIFGIIGLFVIGCCGIVFLRTIVDDSPRIVLDTPQTDTLVVPVRKIDVGSINHKSSLAKALQNSASLQLTVDSLRREVEVLRKYDSELIMDIRQETNNSLDKINGWIAFWIATSCLVCMFVPLIIQLVNWQHNKDQIDNIKLQIEREQEKLNILQFYTNLQVGNDNKYVFWDINNIFTQTMWEECLTGIEKNVNDILKNTEIIKHKDKIDLTKLLLQLVCYIKEIQRWAISYRIRDIASLSDRVYLLYKDLTTNQIYKSDDIKKRFDNIFKEVYPLLRRQSAIN